MDNTTEHTKEFDELEAEGAALLTNLEWKSAKEIVAAKGELIDIAEQVDALEKDTGAAEAELEQFGQEKSNELQTMVDELQKEPE